MKNPTPKWLVTARNLFSALGRFAYSVAERIAATLVVTIILIFFFPDLLIYR